MGKLKVIAISDLHGNLDFNVNKADILCICGDIVPLIHQRPPSTRKFTIDETTSKDNIKLFESLNKGIDESYERWRLYNISWINDEFIPWCDKQPVKKIFLIAGNHDFIFEKEGKEYSKKLFEGTKIEYLEDEETTYGGIRIYGSPWCHQFGPWAFMDNDDKLSDYFSNIPEKIDILLTHDAPYGRDDVLLESQYHMNKGHIGNRPLVNALEKLTIPPSLHFTGHLHSCNHKMEVFGNFTYTVCVSLLNEEYKMVYKPFEIEV